MKRAEIKTDPKSIREITKELQQRFDCENMVLLKDICKEFFNVEFKKAREKANAGTLGVPAFRLVDSVRAPWFVMVEDLATCIDRRNRQARHEWNSVRGAA